MNKRIISMILSATLILGNVSGLEIKAASNEQTAEINAVTLDAPEEEKVWTCVNGVIYVPEGITRLEDGYCRYIGGEGWFPGAKKIVLPSTLEYIGDNAFEMCELEEIVIPGNVKEIGDEAFWGCENLKTVIFEGDYVEKIGGGLFWYCENLETVVMPNAVGEWDTDFAFMSCYKLKNVTVPQEGMDRLGTGMFYACALEEFDIPDCVTTMNYDVFTCCNDLKVLRAGYNVVNFVDGGYTGALNISKGCFGTGYYDLDNVWHRGPANMVLEAPLDSAIVEYARYYRYFKVKYDYPDFERVEYSCDGKILENPEWETHENWHKYGYNKYLVYFDFDIYPRTSSSYVSVERLTYNTFGSAREDSPIDGYDYIYRTFKPDGVNYYSLQERIVIKMDGEWEDGNYPEFNYMPTVEYFKMKCYSQGKDFEDELVDEKYFKVTLTKKSFEEKRVQIEILKSGEWDSEDAEWELLTPAIDTSIFDDKVEDVEISEDEILIKGSGFTQGKVFSVDVANENVDKIYATGENGHSGFPMELGNGYVKISTRFSRMTTGKYCVIVNNKTDNISWKRYYFDYIEPVITDSPEMTPTATVTPEPEKITAEVPTVTAAPTSKPAITKKATPTPGVKVVKPAKTSIKSAKQTVVKKHDKKAYKKEVKLSWKKAKYADGYVIYMKSGTGKYKAVKTITNGKTVSYTKKNIKKGRTYYFKIRAYRKANGQKVYGSYSGVKKIKIK